MSTPAFRRFAWFFVGYLILVILFGAWVRISGSGDGCGSHWPTCGGDVIPQAPSAKTLTEFTHRVMSGLCGILGLVLLVWARRVGRAVFYAALATMFFLVIESLIGAVLVKKELVAGNTSAARAIVIALHLANTLMLTAAAATVAWWAADRTLSRPLTMPRWILVAALAGIVLTNMSGAVTALGDTLFPRQPALDGSLFANVRSDITTGEHFLVRLRILHPVVAVLASALAAFGLLRLRQLRAQMPPYLVRLVSLGLAAIALELLLGVVNVLLGAPAWMQVVHLLFAQVVWLLVWLAALPVFSLAAPRHAT